MRIAIALLLSYSIALIAAGHGAAPVGLLLVTGGLDSWWASGKAVGWIGVTGLVLATLWLRRNAPRRLVYQFLASVLLYLSWFALAYLGASESGSFWSSFVLSVPFQITFFMVAFRLALQYKQSRARSGSAH